MVKLEFHNGETLGELWKANKFFLRKCISI